MTKHTESSALSTEAQARLLDLHPDVALVCDAGMTVLYANAAARKLAGRDLNGEPLESALESLPVEALGADPFEWRHPSGRWLEIFSSSDGERTTIYARDITKRKAQEDRLALALEAGRMGTWEWELASNRVVWSPNLEALHGHPPGTFDGTFDFYLNDVHPEDRDRVLGALRSSLESRSDFSIEYRLVWPDGTVHWTEARGRVIVDASGDAVGMTGLCTEVTERKRSEAALRESEQRYRFLADTLPQLIWTTRPDGFHEYFNQRWYEFTGRTLEETQGEGWSQLLHPDDYDRTVARWTHSLETGEPYEIEYRFRSAADGSYRWFLARAMPMRDEEGRIVRWFGTCTDIDDQKRSESAIRSLEDANARLVEVDRMKDEFLGGLSTQLSSPLNAIQAFADVLEGGALGSLREEQHEYLGRIRASSEVMLASVNELLDLSRLTAGRFRLEWDRVRLDVLLDGVLKTLAPLARMQGLRVLRLGDEEVELERADSDRLEQVLMQLLYGAMRLASSGGMIRVALSVEDGFARVDATHAGVTIPEEHVDKVFTSVAQFGGTWLGLAVPKSIVEAHGGEIGIRAESSGGNTFWFAVPVEGPKGE